MFRPTTGDGNSYQLFVSQSHWRSFGSLGRVLTGPLVIGTSPLCVLRQNISFPLAEEFHQYITCDIYHLSYSNAFETYLGVIVMRLSCTKINDLPIYMLLYLKWQKTISLSIFLQKGPRKHVCKHFLLMHGIQCMAKLRFNVHWELGVECHP